MGDFDVLVQAAAEAVCIRPKNGAACDLHMHQARIALRAAFAKLGECEAAVKVLNDARCLDRNHRIREALRSGGLSLVFGESPCGHARCALAALARFGGQE